MTPTAADDRARPTALVVLSHSAQLARGVAELAASLAPHVRIKAVGGHPDGRLGTDLTRTLETVTELRAQGHEVLVTADLGSAVLTAETVIDLLDDPGVVCEDLPVVRGTLAGAVTAESGGDLAACADAARLSRHSWDPPTGDLAPASAGAPGTPGRLSRQGRPPAAAPPPTPGAPPGPVRSVPSSDPEPGHPLSPAEPALSARTGIGVRRERCRIAVTDPSGIHARPAGAIAAAVADAGAHLTVDGAPATSLFELLALTVRAGDEIEVEAEAAEPSSLLDQVAAALGYRLH